MNYFEIKKLQETLKASEESNKYLFQQLGIERRKTKALEECIQQFNDYVDYLEAELAKHQQKAPMPKHFDQNDVKKGKVGENKAAKYFSSIGYEVTDVSDVPEYQKIDVDFIIENEVDKYTLEVKSSSTAADTRTVWVEDILNIKKNKPGWLHYCKADLLAVVSKNKIFMYNPQEMREYLDAVKAQNKEIEARTDLVKGTFDLFNGQPIEGIDTNLAAKKRKIPEKYMKDSVALIYGINVDKYAATGRFFEEIDL